MNRLLSIDMSTHTGWALFRTDGLLLQYGTYDVPIDGFKAEIKTFRDYPKQYPGNLIDAAHRQLKAIQKLVHQLEPHYVVVEETNKSRQRFSHKALEYMHFALAEHMLGRSDVEFKYLTTKCWRDVVKCYIKHWPEYAKWNGKVGRLKAKAVPTKAGAKVAKLDGKIVTRIDQKKLSVILANEHYKIEIDDDNIADAINMGRAALELKLFR